MRAASPSSSSSSVICSDAAMIISTYRESGGSSSTARCIVRAKPKIVASGVRRSCTASEVTRANDVSCESAMNADGKLVTEDLQASQPDVQLGLSRAGVQGVAKAIHLRWGRFEQVVSAEIDCTVDLVASQKGVHMSRFPELFEDAIERVVIGEALVIEALAQHIVERQRALRAEVRIRAQYPLQRRTPVTKLATQEMVALIGIAAASSEGDVRRLVGVEATGINACPCAQGLVRDQATERLLEAGFHENDVDRILELVPLATHNQRGRGTLYVGTE